MNDINRTAMDDILVLDMPKDLIGYIAWYEIATPPFDDPQKIRNELREYAPYEFALPYDAYLIERVDLRTIAEFAVDLWTTYRRYYYFESEEDAMAFKLRWL